MKMTNQLLKLVENLVCVLEERRCMWFCGTCSWTGMGEEPRIWPDFKLAGTSWVPRLIGTDSIPVPGITLLGWVNTPRNDRNNMKSKSNTNKQSLIVPKSLKTNLKCAQAFWGICQS